MIQTSKDCHELSIDWKQTTYDVILSISDYTDKLKNIKSKVLKVLETYKSENIN